MRIIKKIDEVVNLLQNPGAVGVLPTDTIYGLAARATDKEAVARLYQLKQRDKKPGTLIAASVEQLVELGIPRRYLVPVADYWPNPISIVVPTTPSLSYLDLGKFSLAVRIPAEDTIQSILQRAGPLLTSSANHSGESPATDVSEAQQYFGEQVDFYMDKGQMHQEPSTVIQVVDDAVEVLREGAIKISESGEIIS